MQRAYSYLRFSTTRQARGDSERRQRAWSESYAKSHGLALQSEPRFDDMGKSAFRSKNRTEGALGQFIRYVESGTIPAGSVLLVESLDRMSRDKIGKALKLFLHLLELGIEIITREPAQRFTEQSINEPIQLIIAITIMARAHEESATKAMRSGANWQNKRTLTAQRKPMTAACPGWLRIKADRSGFELIPERAKIVRYIFKLAAEGLSMFAIVRRLNKERVVYFSRFSRDENQGWDTRSVQRILCSRAAVGEFQPMRFTDGTKSKRVPDGEPVKGYFPALVRETTFEKVGELIRARCTQRGPVGMSVANLFTGLLRDARSGCSMTLVSKGKQAPGPRLVSTYAYRGMLVDGKKAKYISVSYNDVERTVLMFLFQTDVSELLPARPESSELRDRLDEEEGQLAGIKRKMAQIEKAMEGDGEQFESLIAVLKKLETGKKESLARIERLRSDLHAAGHSHPIHDLQSFKKTFFSATGDERISLRLKVRSLLQRVVKEIWILPWVDEGKGRTACIQVVFADGWSPKVHLALQGTGPRATIGGDVAKLMMLMKMDLRTWRTLPPKKRFVA